MRSPLKKLAAGATLLLAISACSSGMTPETTVPETTTTTTTTVAPTTAPPTTDHGEHGPVTGAEAAQTGSAALRALLTAQLQEHVYLAGIAVYNAVVNPDAFEASAEVLDLNSQDLAASVGSVYGEDAGEAFLGLWRSHIGMFVDYTTARVGGDEEGQAKAAADLAQYAEDFGAFLAGANPNLPQDAVADLVSHHVMTLVPAVNAVVDGDAATAFAELKTAAAHMSDIAAALAGGIAAQFPDQFPG